MEEEGKQKARGTGKTRPRASSPTITTHRRFCPQRDAYHGCLFAGIASVKQIKIALTVIPSGQIRDSPNHSAAKKFEKKEPLAVRVLWTVPEGELCANTLVILRVSTHLEKTL